MRLQMMSPPARPSAGIDPEQFIPKADRLEQAVTRGRSPQTVHLPTRFDLVWTESSEDAMSIVSTDSSEW
ncbi:hypothetical protein LMH87_009669 [Akanthomyces muscarius]|uniref:Uncharacterized protein n=1 Tax=Akanthomyces muscarius TaxID=2231603 RepID=A0A9W8QBT9_AKAMU|nr:hypothetical protein LMH87_009669 [Akanthomyces muscarius]KAJ4153168.1 hypothetical protein LMH87_009669 [Akanthomyces muscarius]